MPALAVVLPSGFVEEVLVSEDFESEFVDFESEEVLVSEDFESEESEVDLVDAASRSLRRPLALAPWSFL